LHPHKTLIRSTKQGVTFLGTRIFPFYRLLKKRNADRRVNQIKAHYQELTLNKISYDKVYAVFEGWLAYAHHYNTFNLRQKIIDFYEGTFPRQISSIEINRLQNRL
jgi:hypothetical protein